MTADFLRPGLARPRGLAALLVAGLLAACASATGGGPDAGEAPGATADDATSRPACAGDCTLRVENRLDTDVEVSAERQPALPALGIVRSNRTESFELAGFHGQQLEIWVRDEETREILHVTCVRQFSRGVARLVVGSEMAGGAC